MSTKIEFRLCFMVTFKIRIAVIKFNKISKKRDGKILKKFNKSEKVCV